MFTLPAAYSYVAKGGGGGGGGHASASEGSSSHASASEESSTSSGSSRTSSAPRTSSYAGRTYYTNESANRYYNNSGIPVWYWLVLYNSESHPYYECYDQSHNRIPCDRLPATVNHNGIKYSSSEPYTDTAGKSVTYYIKRYDTNSGKPFFVCFDSKFSTITCNRK